MAICCDVNRPVYRFIILFFNCLLTFGSYFCFDMPSVLQDELQGNSTCDQDLVSHNHSCCADCLGLSGSQYNLLYAIYAWTNAVVVIGSGFFIDKFGNQVGVLLFSSFCVVGSSIFAVGAMYRNTATLLPVMLFGRLLFGAGNGSLTIVQNRITSFWFAGKELALAFGITLAFSRLGSVLNFFLTDHIYQGVGLVWTLWIGAILCAFGFISSVIVGQLDVRGVKKLGLTEQIAIQSRRLRVSDMRFFSTSFWLLAFTIMFFYNSVFPFIADASKFIKDKYKFNSDDSAYMAGAVYDVSMILSPFLGGIIDVFGKRGLLAVSCALLTIPVYGLLAFTMVHPLISTIWLGVTYSVAAAALWPSIPLVVSQATIGTAMGLATSLQMIGVGISNVIVGEILGKDQGLPTSETLPRWKYVMIYLFANTLCCVTVAVVLNIIDKRKGGVLNMSRKEVARQMLAAKEDEADEVGEAEPLLDKSSIN